MACNKMVFRGFYQLCGAESAPYAVFCAEHLEQSAGKFQFRWCYVSQGYIATLVGYGDCHIVCQKLRANTNVLNNLSHSAASWVQQGSDAAFQRGVTKAFEPYANERAMLLSEAEAIRAAAI